MAISLTSASFYEEEEPAINRDSKKFQKCIKEKICV